MQSTILEKQIEVLKKQLENLGIEETAEEYFWNTVKISVVAFILAWLLWNLFFHSLFEGIVFSLLFFFVSFTLLLSQPKKKLELRAKKIEKHLPFALMQLSVDLNSGIYFDKALKRISENDYGELSEELKKAIFAGKKASESTPKIMLNLAERNSSRELKRVVAQLVSIYEHGSAQKPGETIRSIALELLAKQKSVSKEFSGKIVVFSLGFIAVSAIIPALFQAFNIVGSGFIEIPFKPIEILIITGVVFPAINLAALLYIKSQTPEFLKG